MNGSIVIYEIVSPLQCVSKHVREVTSHDRRTSKTMMNIWFDIRHGQDFQLLDSLLHFDVDLVIAINQTICLDVKLALAMFDVVYQFRTEKMFASEWFGLQ